MATAKLIFNDSFAHAIESSTGFSVTVEGLSNSSILGWKWSLLSPPGSAVNIGDPNTVTMSFTPDVPGTYMVKLVLYADVARAEPVGVALGAVGVRLGTYPWRIPGAGEIVVFGKRGYGDEVHAALKSLRSELIATDQRIKALETDWRASITDLILSLYKGNDGEGTGVETIDPYGRISGWVDSINDYEFYSPALPRRPKSVALGYRWEAAEQSILRCTESSLAGRFEDGDTWGVAIRFTLGSFPGDTLTLFSLPFGVDTYRFKVSILASGEIFFDYRMGSTTNQIGSTGVVLSPVSTHTLIFAYDHATTTFTAWLDDDIQIAQNASMPGTFSTPDRVSLGHYREGVINSEFFEGIIHEVIATTSSPDLSTRNSIQSNFNVLYPVFLDFLLTVPGAQTAIQRTTLDPSDDPYLTLVSGRIDDVTDTIPQAFKAVPQTPSVLQAIGPGQRPAPEVGGLGMVFNGANSETLREDTSALASLFAPVGGAVPAHTIYIVCDRPASVNQSWVFIGDPGSATQYISLYRGNSGNPVYAQRSTSFVECEGTFAGSGKQVIAGVYKEGEDRPARLYVNGALSGGPTTQNSMSSSNITRFSIGSLDRSSPANFLTGTVYLVFVCMAEHDSLTAFNVSKKLSAKYGI